MFKTFIRSIVVIILFFSYLGNAQEKADIQKQYDFKFQPKIITEKRNLIPRGTYTIGNGGDYPSIDSAFSRLSIDGIAGRVIFELIDEQYSAPTDSLGFFLDGPIYGTNLLHRVFLRPAANKHVVVKGQGMAVFTFNNVDNFVIDGTSTDINNKSSLTIRSIKNSNFIWNDCIAFMFDCDNNLIRNLTIIDNDHDRESCGIGFYIPGPGVAHVAPNNNIIEKNKILEAGIGILVSSTNSYEFASNNIIRFNEVGDETNNLICCGIHTSKTVNTIIENNIIKGITNTWSDLYHARGISLYQSRQGKVCNNVITNVRSSLNHGSIGLLLSGDSGQRGVQNLVYNNMICNIESFSLDDMSRVAGINLWHQNSPMIFFNTVCLTGKGKNKYGSGALILSNNNYDVNIKNNILVNKRNEYEFCAAAINVKYKSVTIASCDHNDLYYFPHQASCLVMDYDKPYFKLIDWKKTTGFDIHSLSEMPHFVCESDLHIDNEFLTNLEAHGIPIKNIGHDIDGQLRNSNHPDIGADEFSGSVVPVELITFNATSQNGEVLLTWSTATETNNLGFEIDRKISTDNQEGEFSPIGYKEGYGTTSEIQSYTFVDDISTLGEVKLSYRLKQIDFDGAYEYSDIVNVSNPAPINFSLLQNYPNPFNPATFIKYQVPNKALVTLFVYDAIGSEVAALVNEIKYPGSYKVEFNAANLPSGVYFYELQSGEFTATRKMLLVK